MKKMVVGLLFNEERTHVILMRKSRPAWQKGLLNGPGGHVKDGEDIFDAIQREFKEETGIDVPALRSNDPETANPTEWQLAIFLQGEDWEVSFFRAFIDDKKFFEFRTMTDEHVFGYQVDELYWRRDMISNLRWIIPFCQDPCATLPLVVTHDHDWATVQKTQSETAAGRYNDPG